LRARSAEGCRNGQQLHRELVAYGFRGTRLLVATFVAQLRRAERAGTPGTPITPAGDPLTPHTAAMLLLRRPEGCHDAERAAIEQLRACHPDIATTMAFTERFTSIVRERCGEELSQWSIDAQASAIREIGQFALKIRQDEAAVRAGLHAELVEWPDRRASDPTEAVETADVWAGEVRSVTATCSRRMTDRFTKSDATGEVVGGTYGRGKRATIRLISGGISCRF